MLDKMEGIILAAGLSSRAKAFKMTWELKGLPIIDRCIESMYQVCGRIIVIGGHKIEKLSYLPIKYPKVEIVFNKGYKNGMFHSVCCGLKAIRGGRAFVIPGDYPLVSPITYTIMTKVPHQIVIPSYGAFTGHPILLSQSIIQKLLATKNHNNLRDFIFSQDYQIIDVDDPGILMDIDTHLDYQAAAEYCQKLSKGLL